MHEADGEIVACGGVRTMFVRGDWTRGGLGRAILESCERAARAEGFKTLALGATLAGLALSESFAFRPLARFTVTMPDGVSVEAVAMERAVDPPPLSARCP